jgi:hypothetical protein
VIDDALFPFSTTGDMGGMRMRFFASLGFGVLLLAAAPPNTASAMPILQVDRVSGMGIETVQYNNKREFNRCMREKYGRNYYRGVKRAHRFHMAQACGG